MATKMVTELELNSFLIKFKQLCKAGFEATMQLRSRNRIAAITLDVTLGPLQHAGGPCETPTKQKRTRSPAHHRQ